LKKGAVQLPSLPGWLYDGAAHREGGISRPAARMQRGHAATFAHGERCFW
jgi:hypothetical protein